MSFGQKTTNGFVWNFIETVANYGSLFVIGIILARLLSPAEFGAIGILSIFLAVFDTIVDCGFSNALIRKQRVNDIDYDTIFIFNVGISIILYILFFFISPLISRFFGDDSLSAYARVLGLIVVINAFSIVQRTILTRDINFKRQALISICATLTGGVVGISMAYRGYGVWSLVGQSLAKQTTTTLLFWCRGHWRPNFRFSYSSFKGMFGFGWRVLLSGIISTVWAQMYTFVIGKVYSKETLGLYSRANQFVHIFTINMTAMIRKVTYPALCSIQEDEIALVSTFRSTIKLLALLSWSGLFTLAGVAEPLVLTLLGEKWIGCIAYLRLLCFTGFTYSVNVLNLNMLQVKGRSDYFLNVEIISKIIGILPLFIGIFVGIKQMLYCSIFVNILMYLIGTKFCNLVLCYPTKQQLLDLLHQLIIPIILAVITYSVTLLNMNNILTLFVQVIVAIVIFIFLGKKICHSEYNILINLFHKILHK